VRRGEMPGEGLWALPGGHVKPDETFLSAAIRELIEETCFADMDAEDHNDRASLRLLVRGEKFLDNPWRSTRKRTISMAYGFLVPGTDQPFVKGSDDAKEARWWAIDEVTRGMMFEDHYNVIEDFAARFRNVVL
jgi:bifunctional NMN adenylyltransferase/nudix hydrolase